jgi:hypothetical protein
LLAERKEAWRASNPARSFDERLVSTEPLPLYLACLSALLEKYSQGSIKGVASAGDFQIFLEREFAKFRQMGRGETIPAIEQLL